MLTASQANDLIERDEHHVITTPPDIVAGRLLRAVSHPDNNADPQERDPRRPVQQRVEHQAHRRDDRARSS